MRLWSVIGGWQYWSAYMIKIHMIRNCGFTWLHVLFVFAWKEIRWIWQSRKTTDNMWCKIRWWRWCVIFSLAAATSAKYECIASGAYYRYCKCSPIVVNKQRLKHIWMWFGRFQTCICESRNFLNGEVNEQDLDIPQLMGSLLLKWTGGGGNSPLEPSEGAFELTHGSACIIGW